MKTTLSKLIEEASSESRKMEGMGYDYDLFQYFDLHQMNSRLVDEALLELPLKTWICTDTPVGYYAIYLNQVLHGYRYKPYRKSDSTYYFLSKEHKYNLHMFLKTCEIEDQTYSNYVSVDEEFELELKEDSRFPW